MKYIQPNAGRFIRTFILMPLLIFIFVRICIIAPQFYPYLLFLVGLVAIFFIAGKYMHRITASECASCRGPLSNLGVKKVFSGRLNEEGGENFDPIGIKVFRCDNCEKEYHELVYYSGVTGEAVDHKNIFDLFFPYIKTMMVLRGEMPNLVNKDFKFRSTTKEQYIEIKRKLAKEVIAHNRKNGYLGNPIKIDLKSNS